MSTYTASHVLKGSKVSKVSKVLGIVASGWPE